MGQRVPWPEWRCARESIRRRPSQQGLEAGCGLLGVTRWKPTTPPSTQRPGDDLSGPHRSPCPHHQHITGGTVHHPDSHRAEHRVHAMAAMGADQDEVDVCFVG